MSFVVIDLMSCINDDYMFSIPQRASIKWTAMITNSTESSQHPPPD